MTKDGLCLLKYKTWHPWSFKRTEFNLSFVVPLFYPFWYHFINSMLFSKVTEYYSLFLKKQNKTKQNPKLTAPWQRTIGNESPRLPAMIIIMNLCEKCHWDSAMELNSLPHFIGTYWAWQFDERIVDYLDALPSQIGSSLIKSIYWVLVTTSVTVRRKEKN